MIAPITRADGDNKLDSIADRPVSDEAPGIRYPGRHLVSPATLDRTVEGQLSSIPDFLRDAVVRLSAHEGWAPKLNKDTEVIPVTQTVVNRAVASTFQSEIFYAAVKQTAHSCVFELRIVEAVKIRKADARGSTVLVAQFFK